MKRSLLLILSLILIGTYSFCTHSNEPDAPSIIDSEKPVIVGDRPLFKDFMGINGHFTFKPELYNQVCRLVRNYHNINWDVKKPGDNYQPPYAVNGVNWKDHVYGPWKASGFETDICIQLSSFNANNALKQLYETLGDYRLKRVVKKVDGDVYVYEFEHGSNPDNLIWVAWSPTGTKTHKKDNYIARIANTTLSGLPSLPVKVMGMATSKEEVSNSSWEKTGDGAITLSINEGPTHIIFDKKIK